MKQGDSREGAVAHRFLAPMQGTLRRLVQYELRQECSPACKQQGCVDPVSGTFTETVRDKPKLFCHEREYSCQASLVNQEELL